MSSAPPPPKKVYHTPSATISHSPPQKSQEPEAPGPAEQVLESTSLTAPFSFRGRDPSQYATPLHSVGGCQEGLQMSG